MSYKSLSAPTMLTVSSPWTDANRDRPTLEAYPELSGHLMMLDRARRGLLDTQLDEGEVNEQLDALTAEITELDALHDRKARAAYGYMSSLAEDADDPAERAAWLSRRDTLFPDALSINNTSYMDEAGNADQVRARMTPELRKALEETNINGKPLSETVDAWVGAGEALGNAITKRARLKKATDEQSVSADDVRRARFFWIKAVDGFVNFLDMVDMDDEKRDELLSPLEEAIRAATQNTDQPVVDEPVDEPTPEEPTDEEPTDEEPTDEDIVVEDLV